MVLTWKSIPADVKLLFLDYLNYEDRCNLKLCSKDDKSLVDSTRYIPKLITIGEQPGNGSSIIYLRYESIIMELVEKSMNQTEIFILQNQKNKKKVQEISKGRYEIAREWLEKISENGRIEAKKIRILNSALQPCETWILKCDHLEIRMIGAQKIESWLQKTVAKLENLEILDWKIGDIIEMDQVKNTRKVLKISREISINDGQFGRIRAPSLMISGTLAVGHEAVKKAFEKYVEKSRYGDRFELKFQIPEAYDPMDLFQKSWIIEKTGVEDVTEGEYHFKISGGFENLYGVKEIPSVIIYKFSGFIILKAFHFMDQVTSPLFY